MEFEQTHRPDVDQSQLEQDVRRRVAPGKHNAAYARYAGVIPGVSAAALELRTGFAAPAATVQQRASTTPRAGSIAELGYEAWADGFFAEPSRRYPGGAQVDEHSAERRGQPRVIGFA